MIMTAIVTVIAAYLIGSINFAVVFSGVFLKKDVRDMGSGNAGTTNMMRVGGFLPGALTFLCDALKGFVACFIGELIFEYILNATSASWALPSNGAFLCGLACMLGHVFPIFFQFKGGKGVATSVGIFAVCCPIAIIIGLCVFAVSTLLSRIVSLSSLIATVTVVVMSVIFYDRSGSLAVQIILSVAMGLIVFLKHKENIIRLINGEENKIGRRK
ncbi:MAG: glycerol-3-phosphate 1-O-acyltransferase PlsY [Clostridia bacterium]|nr:glycerol-3-phosphate 1-O-acyltransferase PlsY [Clostridia bacterium]